MYVLYTHSTQAQLHTPECVIKLTAHTVYPPPPLPTTPYYVTHEVGILFGGGLTHSPLTPYHFLPLSTTAYHCLPLPVTFYHSLPLPTTPYHFLSLPTTTYHVTHEVGVLFRVVF